jgi:hypothetical protein
MAKYTMKPLYIGPEEKKEGKYVVFIERHLLDGMGCFLVSGHSGQNLPRAGYVGAIEHTFEDNMTVFLVRFLDILCAPS